MTVHRFACLTVAATFFLIIAGGLVTSTGSALAVPDWPLSFGMVMPPMVGGILYEHGHRMIAGTVAIMMFLLALWIAWKEPRRWVKVLGFVAFGAIIAQAVLGGLTVLLLLPPAISVAHAALAQTFFCLTVTLALVTSPRWPEAAGAGRAEDPASLNSVGRGRRAAARASKGEDLAGKSGSWTRGLVLVLFSAVYVQLLIGAWMRHTDAGLAIPDFPLAFGHLIPPIWSPQIATHFAHRVWALVVLGSGAAFIVSSIRASNTSSGVARPAGLLAALLPVQITLGALTVLSGKSVAITTAHVATGAFILATTLVAAIRLWRPEIEARFPARSRAGAPASDPALPHANGDRATA